MELLSLLGPASRKKTDNGVAPIDASANNWRKSKDRMVLYELQKHFRYVLSNHLSDSA